MLGYQVAICGKVAAAPIPPADAHMMMQEIKIINRFICLALTCKFVKNPLT